MDYNAFERSILASALFSAPADTVDTFTEQLKHIISSTLTNYSVHSHTHYRRQVGYINRFLSQEAMSAERKRRRLERYWKKTAAPIYRRHCAERRIV